MFVVHVENGLVVDARLPLADPRLADAIVEIDWSQLGSIELGRIVPLARTAVRTFRGNQDKATGLFMAESRMTSRAGYEPTNQSWVAGQWSTGAFLFALLLCIVLLGILVFIYMLIVKPEGTLTVTYRLQERPQVTVAPADPTKVCPRCAESVKAAALVCRYCGHEFAPA